VTFGGGMTMEYAGFGDFGSAAKQPVFSQWEYHFVSMAAGS
jgi:hypothetical protein